MRKVLVVGVAAAVVSLGAGGTAMAASGLSAKDGGLGGAGSTIQVVPSPSYDDHGIDDPATHDANDDHGGLRPDHGNGADDPATHDANDDHGGNANRGSTSGSGRHGSDD